MSDDLLLHTMTQERADTIERELESIQSYPTLTIGRGDVAFLKEECHEHGIEIISVEHDIDADCGPITYAVFHSTADRESARKLLWPCE